MGDILNKAKKLLSASDYFNSSNMLRFQKEDDYKTISGGLISLAIIVVIMVAFTREILITLERTSIQVKSNILKVDIPTKSRLTFQPQANQMFAIEISGISPTSDIRYFDVFGYVFDFDESLTGPSQYTVLVKMVPCTNDLWQGFDINGLNLNNLFCPQLGTSFDIFGKFSTGKQRFFNLYVQPCILDEKCASQQQTNLFWSNYGGAVTYNIYYINTILTPDQPNFRKYYFEEKYYGYIGPTFGSDLKIEFSEYSVTTDQSIWPYTDEVVQNGLFVPYGVQIINFPRSDAFPNYLSLTITKSTDTFTYEREVQKLSTIFSYIGGVISSLLTAFFIMNKYTSFAFEMSVANQLFERQKKAQKQCENTEIQNADKSTKTSLSMSIFLYFKYLAFELSNNRFKQIFQSEDMQYIKQCHEQMTKQLDIKRIIKRINCLEHCVVNIVEGQKLQNLLFNQPASVSQVKKNRLLFQVKEKDISQTQSDMEKSAKPDIVNGNDKIMQDKICQEMSAAALSKGLQENYKSCRDGLKRNQQKNQNQAQPNYNKVVQLDEMNSNMGKSKPRAKRIQQLKIAKSLYQDKNQSFQYDDAFEIPYQYSNLQQK